MNEIFEEWLKYRTNYKKLKDWKTGLCQLIIDRYPTPENNMTSGFIHRTIVGDPGYGKSTYALKVIAKIHYTMNGFNKIDNEEDSYKYAIDNMIFSPQELFEKMDYQMSVNKPALVWCLDDASVHMGTQLWEDDRATYRKLRKRMPTIRDKVTGLLITTPQVSLLAKPLREFLRRKVEIKLISEFKSMRRVGRHYEKQYYPDDIRFRMRIPFQDKFSCLIPEPFYAMYRDKKKLACDLYEQKPPKVIDEEDIDEDDEGDKEIEI